jgi:hypothetical protein
MMDKNNNINTSSVLFCQSGLVASRQIGDQTLLVPIMIKAGEPHGLYTLNPTASVLWKLLEIPACLISF